MKLKFSYFFNKNDFKGYFRDIFGTFNHGLFFFLSEMISSSNGWGVWKYNLKQESAPLGPAKLTLSLIAIPPYQVVVSCTHPKDEEDEIGNACTNSLKKITSSSVGFQRWWCEQVRKFWLNN